RRLEDKIDAERTNRLRHVSHARAHLQQRISSLEHQTEEKLADLNQRLAACESHPGLAGRHTPAAAAWSSSRSLSPAHRLQSPPPPSRTTRRSNRSVGEAPPERTRSEERPTDAEDEAEPLSSARSGMSRARSAHHLNSISSTSARQPGTLSTSSTAILSSTHPTRTGSDGNCYLRGPTSARSQSSRVSSPHYLPMAPSKGSSAWGPVRRAVGKASGARESTSGGSRSGGSMLRGYSGSNRELNLLTSYLSQMRSNVRELRQQFES
ncbi:unnamed protein product, partial [Cyprideis torosa]